ncbi:MAG: hypothetical protein ACOZIN_17515 [Myxococcota bacterium]
MTGTIRVFLLGLACIGCASGSQSPVAWVDTKPALEIIVLSPRTGDDFAADPIVVHFRAASPCPIKEISYSLGQWSSVLRAPPWREEISRDQLGAIDESDVVFFFKAEDECGHFRVHAHGRTVL